MKRNYVNSMSLKRSLNFAVFAVLTSSTALVQAQSLLDTIRTPDKAVPVVNQALAGTWLLEVLGAGQPAGSETLSLTTFQPDGTAIGIIEDGNRSPAFGLWIRVGDRKFLGTSFLFNFDEKRALATVIKLRQNIQLSPDGQTSTATSEGVVMDRNGKVLATIPGARIKGTRLSLEIPGDFYDFQKLP